VTPEARLDRLERIAKLFVRAGLRYRNDLRALGDKIDIVVNAQIKNEELFSKNEERFAKNEERFAKNEERFAKNEARFAKNEARFARFEMRVEGLFEETDRRLVQLAESQARTEQNLNTLIDSMRRGRNGDGSQNN